MSKKVWDSLEPAQREQIVAAANEARSYQRQLAREANEQRLADLEASGMKVNRIDAIERQRFVEQAQQVIGRNGETIGAEFLAAWQAELGKQRGAQ
ncbi:Bacterial extracellular solute-binding protein, family 7 [compost metagenome]